MYCGETLDIAPEHRQKGLSVPMILEAIKDREQPTTRTNLTYAGHAALKNAWLVAHGCKTSKLKNYDPSRTHWEQL